jgi:hypothetical protein
VKGFDVGGEGAAAVGGGLEEVVLEGGLCHFRHQQGRLTIEERIKGVGAVAREFHAHKMLTKFREHFVSISGWCSQKSSEAIRQISPQNPGLTGELIPFLVVSRRKYLNWVPCGTQIFSYIEVKVVCT